MDKKSFSRGAKSHLARGLDLYAKGEFQPEFLFYSALELRFGIESRLREYIEYQEHVSLKKKRGWQISELNRTVEAAFSGCVSEVHVIAHSNNYPVMKWRYTPVTPELQGIGEKLGGYLHAPKANDLVSSEQWREFDSLLKRGFELLKYACEGSLLGVPLIDSESKLYTLNSQATKDQGDIMSAIRRFGSDIEVEVKYFSPLV
ncbi:hypothetical protein [Pseudomonas entomophila]|uniref:hypothetical protein n=1 Tax=Pseudomonas entomophila TaxID=312306 RepID=UPI001F00E53D|nr:hypothetical protein [Pseudomonas entomophila]MCG8291981.1 hypothetical protein [Pseudomonas entomophila]